MANALAGVHTLKLNTLEAAAVLGHDVDDLDDADVTRAAEQLISMGVDRVFLTRGHSGSSRMTAPSVSRCPAPSAKVVNATGAGDAFSAGVACGMLMGLDLRQTAALGSAMAAVGAGPANEPSTPRSTCRQYLRR